VASLFRRNENGDGEDLAAATWATIRNAATGTKRLLITVIFSSFSSPLSRVRSLAVAAVKSGFGGPCR
jgi:hypothetical protein